MANRRRRHDQHRQFATERVDATRLPTRYTDWTPQADPPRTGLAVEDVPRRVAVGDIVVLDYGVRLVAMVAVDTWQSFAGRLCLATVSVVVRGAAWEINGCRSTVRPPLPSSVASHLAWLRFACTTCHPAVVEFCTRE